MKIAKFIAIKNQICKTMFLWNICLKKNIYQDQECYVIKLTKIPESQGITESAVINPTTPENKASSLSLALSQESNYRQANSENDSSLLWVYTV